MQVARQAAKYSPEIRDLSGSLDYFNSPKELYTEYNSGTWLNPDSIISINSEIKLLDKLRSEVCRIPRKPNGSGKIQLMSKKEMKDKYDIDSPGMADCLAMGEEVPELAQEETELEFSSLW